MKVSLVRMRAEIGVGGGGEGEEDMLQVMVEEEANTVVV